MVKKAFLMKFKLKENFNILLILKLNSSITKTGKMVSPRLKWKIKWPM